ncbi:MAG: hypothetical protein VB817_05620 [Pirellulaceae bacterium]
MITPADNSSTDLYVQRHFRFGWWSLLLFLSLGLVLEALHGFKVQSFLADQYEARRLVWRLAHAHGTLLGLVHIAYAYTLNVTGITSFKRARLASSCLNSASVLLPGGFFLGGIYIYDGDPGLGVFLAPIGGLALLVAVFCIAREVSASGDDEAEATEAAPAEQEDGEQE